MDRVDCLNKHWTVITERRSIGCLLKMMLVHSRDKRMKEQTRTIQWKIDKWCGVVYDPFKFHNTNVKAANVCYTLELMAGRTVHRQYVRSNKEIRNEHKDDNFSVLYVLVHVHSCYSNSRVISVQPNFSRIVDLSLDLLYMDFSLIVFSHFFRMSASPSMCARAHMYSVKYTNGVSIEK